MKIIWWLLVGAATMATVLAAVAVAARFADGPIGPFAGGPFRTGRAIRGPDPDWSFADTIQNVELQLVEPPRSRTAHIIVHGGQIYVLCGIVKFGPFVFLGQAFWKQWPYQAVADGRAVLRIDGDLYERQAVKVTDPMLFRELSMLVSQKYGMGVHGPLDPESVWFFRLSPRSE